MAVLTIEKANEQLTRDEVERRKERLVERLELGWQKIEDARERGESVPRWERAWLRLLEEYETLCRLAA